MKQRLALLFIAFTLVLQGQESLGALSLKYPFLDTTKQSLQYFGSEDAWSISLRNWTVPYLKRREK